MNSSSFQFPISSVRPSVELAPPVTEEEVKNFDFSFDQNLFQSPQTDFFDMELPNDFDDFNPNFGDPDLAQHADQSFLYNTNILTQQNDEFKNIQQQLKDTKVMAKVSKFEFQKVNQVDIAPPPNGACKPTNPFGSMDAFQMNQNAAQPASGNPFFPNPNIDNNVNGNLNNRMNGMSNNMNNGINNAISNGMNNNINQMTNNPNNSFQNHFNKMQNNGPAFFGSTNQFNFPYFKQHDASEVNSSPKGQDELEEIQKIMGKKLSEQIQLAEIQKMIDQKRMKEQQKKIEEQRRIEQTKILHEKILQEQRLKEQRRQEQLLQEQRMQEQRLQEQRMQEQRLQEQRMQEQRLQEQRLQEQRMQEQRLQEQRLQEQRLQEQRLQEQRLQEQRLQEQRLQEQRLQEQRLQEQRLQEQRLQEQRLQEQRLQEQRLQEQRMQEQRMQEQRMQEQRMQEQRMQEQRMQEQIRLQQLQQMQEQKMQEQMRREKMMQEQKAKEMMQEQKAKEMMQLQQFQNLQMVQNQLTFPQQQVQMSMQQNQFEQIRMQQMQEQMRIQHIQQQIQEQKLQEQRLQEHRIQQNVQMGMQQMNQQQPFTQNFTSIGNGDFNITDFNTIDEYEMSPESFTDYNREVCVDDLIELQNSSQKSSNKAFFKPTDPQMLEVRSIKPNLELSLPKRNSREVTKTERKFAVQIPNKETYVESAPMKISVSAPIPRTFDDELDDSNNTPKERKSSSNTQQIPENEMTFNVAMSDPTLIFFPLTLGFEPHEYWLFQERQITFKESVVKFFRHTKTNYTKFMYKLYDMLRLTTCFPQLKKAVGVFFINKYVIMTYRDSLVNMLGINPKSIDGSLFHKQGNFRTHGFIEVNERNYKDAGFDTIPKLNSKDVRLLYHKDFKFSNQIMNTKELDAIMYENEDKKYYSRHKKV